MKQLQGVDEQKRASTRKGRRGRAAIIQTLVPDGA